VIDGHVVSTRQSGVVAEASAVVMGRVFRRSRPMCVR
jgi:hypothetical protein